MSQENESVLNATTQWGLTYININIVEDVNGQHPSLLSLKEQFKCTLLGLGYSQENLDREFQ
jgi:hypothetical protein